MVLKSPPGETKESSTEYLPSDLYLVGPGPIADSSRGGTRYLTLSTTFNRIQKETVQVDLTNIDGQPDNTTQITVANSNPAAVSVTPSGSLPTRVFNLVGTIVGNSVVTFTAGALSGSIAVAVTPSPDMSSMTITLGPITSKF